ncbi:hypothetical protein A0H81_13624 [Grifola frondosa]|uniref:Cyanovirin-N domain-containing protein n=1 Tax=Grifola frondosa TaxID=5627 RepID=A0A1C7LUG1_GRIFR|nr:hypothetical protein A0H81_13624 [Grifola frondosa]
MQFSLLSSVTLALVVASLQVAADKFGHSCYDQSLANNHTLYATCSEGPGKPSRSSSIDLNLCVQNCGGTLECTVNGYFDFSCKDCSLISATILTCDCGLGNTTKDLNSCVSNRYGELKCP